MADFQFEWDLQMADTNWQKHGVSFEEAVTAFWDEHGRVIPDPDHSADEDRFILLGLSSSLRLLVVCHVYRATPEVVGIISARRAERSERDQYGAN